MQITIDLPDALANRLETAWGNLELVVIEAYRDMLISAGRAKELLNFSTILELDAFFKDKRVDLHYDMDDFEHDVKILQELKASLKSE